MYCIIYVYIYMYTSQSTCHDIAVALPDNLSVWTKDLKIMLTYADVCRRMLIHAQSTRHDIAFPPPNGSVSTEDLKVYALYFLY